MPSDWANPVVNGENWRRIRLGLDEDQEVLINIGRQDYQKGQRYLLEAMAMLVSTRPRLVLLDGRSGPGMSRANSNVFAIAWV